MLTSHRFSEYRLTTGSSGYEISEGGLVRGTLETDGAVPRVLTASGEWAIGVHRRHGWVRRGPPAGGR